MNKISIVILNWNRPKDTVSCIESLGNLSIDGYSLQVIVVDNASSDSSDKIIGKEYKKMELKNIRYFEIIKNETNLGFASGNNVGMRHAINHGSEFVMVLNNDTQTEKSLIIQLTDMMRKNKQLAAVSPKIYFAKGYEFHKDRYKEAQKGRVIWYAGGEIDWDNIYGTNRGVDEVDAGQYDETSDTDFFTGACVLLRTDALRETGLFNDNYFMYLEDIELSQRLKKKGWKVFYTSKAHLWHKVAQSSKIGGSLNDYFITRNRLLFGMRYAKIRTRFALYKESLKLISNGREWQKRGVIDYYLMRWGRGSWKDTVKK